MSRSCPVAQTFAGRTNKQVGEIFWLKKHHFGNHWSFFAAHRPPARCKGSPHPFAGRQHSRSVFLAEQILWGRPRDVITNPVFACSGSFPRVQNLCQAPETNVKPGRRRRRRIVQTGHHHPRSVGGGGRRQTGFPRRPFSRLVEKPDLRLGFAQ
jgi:hypothetical protein